MLRILGSGWIFIAVMGLPIQVHSQEPLDPRTLTAKEKDRREALHLYILGLLQERDNNIFQALQAFQDSIQLDPEAPAVYRAMVPHLMALDKGAQAVAACEKVVELDPADYETWYALGRLNKALSQFKEARLAMEKGLALPIVKSHPEVIQQMSFELGGVLEILKEPVPAIAAFLVAAKILDHPETLLEIGPFERSALLQRSAEIYERLGLLYRQTGKIPEAIDAFEQSHKRWPAGEVRTSFHLAQLLHEQKQHAPALEALDRYLRFQPQALEAYEMKIDLLRKLGRNAQVFPWLKKAAEVDSHNKGLRLLLGRQYLLSQRIEEAEKIYLDLADKTPSPEVYEELFKLYKNHKLAGNVEVLDLFNNVTEKAKEQVGLAPQQARAMVVVIRQDRELALDLLKLGLQQLDGRNDNLKFETVHFLAILSDRQRKPLEAEKFYRAALNRAQPTYEAIIYSGLLRVLWRQGKHEEVVAICERGLVQAKGTKPVLFHNEKGKALARLERFDDALAEADKAIEIAADNERLTVRHARVRILSQADRFADAEREALGLLKEFTGPGETTEIRYLLSNIYNHAKYLDKSEEELLKILRSDPSNATANNDLGYLWADRNKNLKEAEEMVRRALELERHQRKTLPNLAEEDDYDNAAFLDSLAWVLFRQGQIQEARRELERACKLPDGDDPVLFDHLGDVYHRLGQLTKAQTAYEKAVELYEREKRRKMDDRYRDLQRKLKLVKGD